jgi:hypothetical protein
MTSMDEQPEPPEDSQSSFDDSQSSSADTQPSPAAQASPSGARFWLRIALPLVVLIVVVVATVYVVADGSSHPATSTSLPASPGTAASLGPGATPASHGPSATRKASAKAGVQAAGIPAGGLTGSAALTKLGSTALPLPKELEARVTAWDRGRGGAALAALSGQFGNVLQAAGVKEYALMRMACVQLAAEVATAQATPPIPDAAMQRLYAKALADFAKGAADCRAAVSQRPTGDETIQTRENAALLHRALSLVAAGSTDLYRATAEIEALKHR